jgi:hypothetical protein
MSDTAKILKADWCKNGERAKAKLDSVLAHLDAAGWNLRLSEDIGDAIVNTRITRKNLSLAFVAAQLVEEQHPITLRGLLYQVVSAGWLPSTDRKPYSRLGRIMTTLREKGAVPFSWIVDNIRSTAKPSSWTGLADFADSVKECYRKDFWAELPDYVHVIVEKDAIAGVLAPTTNEYDVALSPVRGYVSLSFAHEIASTWNRIDKPIYAFYLGDFDPSGFDLERDLKEKLTRYCTRSFQWQRLGVNLEDFDTFNLIRLEPKKKDKRYKRFVAEHGESCAELDAIPATVLRERVEQAITAHIDLWKWERLQETERLEQDTIRTLAGAWSA